MTNKLRTPQKRENACKGGDVEKRIKFTTADSEAKRNLSALYKQPLKATRVGPLFSAFPYPTKISPEVIALFIAAHTNPGETVFDGFAGSGTTGIAALLCARPSEAMREQARELGLKIRWGARRVVLRELGTLGSFVGRTLCQPPDPIAFQREAERVLSQAERELSWLYEARDPEGEIGAIRYVIWSELLECSHCHKAVTLWDASVHRMPARIDSSFSCPHCKHRTSVANAQRRTEKIFDDLLKKNITVRVRRPVWVYGVTDRREWSRPVEASDRSLISRIDRTSLPQGVPITAVPWGDLYRSGYHMGISHLHHFYTRRNLIIFSTLWQLTNSSRLRDALRFWLLSYNASHSTIMTRVVAKHGQRDLVVTSSQPGVLYVSGLPVEKNLFAGLRRKLKTIRAAFDQTYGLEENVEVKQGSSLELDLPNESVDYVFTDPPFGGNIPYAEVNFINEAWLGRCTDSQDEVTISRVQGKGASEYQKLMTQAFREIARILRKDAKSTVVFHSSSSKVWNNLRHSYTEAGLGVEDASILDKTQGSFKQVTTNGAVKGDALLLLRKQPRWENLDVPQQVLPVMEKLLKTAHASQDRSERTPQWLYSRFVMHYLTREQSVPLDANDFYELVAAKSILDERYLFE